MGNKVKKEEKKQVRYNTGYLEHFEWNIEMETPSVTGGLKEKE